MAVSETAVRRAVCGALLHVMRTRKGLTQTQAAGLIGLSKTTYLRMERGVQTMHDAALGRLSQTYLGDSWALGSLVEQGVEVFHQRASLGGGVRMTDELLTLLARVSAYLVVQRRDERQG